MIPHRESVAIVAAASIVAALSPAAVAQASAPSPESSVFTIPHNPYGAHLVRESADGRGGEELRWVRRLVGQWGHVKTMFMGITPETRGAARNWRGFVETCYDLELVPVIRLAGVYRGDGWIKPQPDAPGDYHSLVEAVRTVVAELPRRDGVPLYIEVWNEPNLGVEWNGVTDAAEYAAFFVQTAAAIREIGDPRIRILNGALALSPEFTEELCAADPGFVDAFDVWASHPYPMNRPPEVNLHAGPAEVAPSHTIDAYRLELDVLRRFGRDDVRVMITETGYDLGNDVLGGEGYPIVNEVNRADYMARAFRDYWSQWDEVVAVFPFLFAGEGWERFEWVYPDSGSLPDGSPSRPHLQYTAVAALAKPTDPTGAVSGRVCVSPLGVPVEGVDVSAGSGAARTATDAVGAFYLHAIAPGEQVLRFALDGFATVERPVVIAAGRNTVADVSVDATAGATLEVVVRDGATGAPLPGVSLEFSPPVEGDARTTDADGRAGGIPLLPVGYRVTLAKDGYTTTTLPEFRAAAGETPSIAPCLGPRRAPDWENLLGNPGFEEGGGGGGRDGIGLRFEPLAPGPCRLADGTAFSGTRSQAIDARDNGETVVRQITHYGTALPGRRYVAAAWCRTRDLPEGGARLSLDFAHDSGAVIERAGEAAPVPGDPGGWQFLEVEGVAPEGSRRISVNLHVGEGSGVAWFDDVFLGLDPEPTP